MDEKNLSKALIRESSREEDDNKEKKENRYASLSRNHNRDPENLIWRLKDRLSQTHRREKEKKKEALEKNC